MDSLNELSDEALYERLRPVGWRARLRRRSVPVMVLLATAVAVAGDVVITEATSLLWGLLAAPFLFFGALLAFGIVVTLATRTGSPAELTELRRRLVQLPHNEILADAAARGDGLEIVLQKPGEPRIGHRFQLGGAAATLRSASGKRIGPAGLWPPSIDAWERSERPLNSDEVEALNGLVESTELDELAMTIAATLWTVLVVRVRDGVVEHWEGAASPADDSAAASLINELRAYVG